MPIDWRPPCLTAIWVLTFGYILLTSIKAPNIQRPYLKRTSCPPTSSPGPDVVVFIPSAIPRHARRRLLFRQMLPELAGAHLFFVFGLDAPSDLLVAAHIEARQVGPQHYRFVDCRDSEDDPANGTAACKVYQALRHIAAAYADAPPRFVWRSADDTYLDLAVFRRIVAPGLQTCRMLLGRLRFPWPNNDADLYLHPRYPDLYGLLGLLKFGKHMQPMAYCMTWDVAAFIGAAPIPPRQIWCEDVIVSHWLLFYDVDLADMGEAAPGVRMIRADQEPIHAGAPLLIAHGMRPRHWVGLHSTAES